VPPRRPAALLAVAFSTLVVATALARASTPAIGSPTSARSATLVTAGQPVDVSLSAATAGEGVLDLTVASPGADWSAGSAQASVLEVDVDGAKATDLDVPTADPTARRVQLGTVGAGVHAVRVLLSPSSPRASVTVADPVASLSTDRALAYSPVLYGRTVASLGPATQNAYDDAPLLSWHDASVPAPGQTRYDYSVIWTNEDEGTGSPDLMGRWGRTVDIELAYSVTLLDATHTVLSETFQGPNHVTMPFRGRHSGTHPLLQTCTGNNNFCDDDTAQEGSTAAAPVGGPLVYLMTYDETIPAGRARESLLDRHPWIYGVMAAEQRREGKVSTAVCVPAASDTVHVCDQRRYLYLEVMKSTGEPKDPTGTEQPVGVSLDVVLRDGRIFTSDRGILGRTAVRDVPINEAVELPAGTTEGDVVEVRAVRQSTETTLDPQSPVTVTALNKGLFLDDAYDPRPSFATSTGSWTLTVAAPQASIWRRAAVTPPAALPEAGAPALLLVLAAGAGALVLRRRRRSTHPPHDRCA